jgi:hypothetical protein
VAFSGLSLIGWVLNWVCWKKRLLCCKLYHNTTTKRIFWWCSFILLCGIIAFCISGILVTVRFGRFIRVTECAYERIYYDSQFGELKDSSPRWEGLETNLKKLDNSKQILDKIDRLAENLLSEGNWTNNEKLSSNSDFKFKGKNFVSYVKEMQKELEKCFSIGHDLMTEEGDLLFDSSNPYNQKSIIGKFLSQINEITTPIIGKYDEMRTSILDLQDNAKEYEEDLEISLTNFTDVSSDLKNYQSGFLNKVKYYIKVAKGCGYILVLVYLCILALISFFGTILLLAYSFLSNQGNLDSFMHIVWNSTKFFSFSFLFYAAAFGMLYNGLRDLIVYNEFLFGDNLNLTSSETYLLPNKESKAFLYFCLNEEKADFLGDLDFSLSDSLEEVFTNFGELNNLLQKNFSLDFKSEYTIKTNTMRYLQESNTANNETNSDSSGLYDETTDILSSIPIEINEDFTINLPMATFNNMINQLKESFNTFKSIIEINSVSSQNIDSNQNSENNINSEIYNFEGGFLQSFNCGFLKNDVNLVYNSLYDLSVQSRILFALSCCIGIFGEVFVNFYLLSMYHYNNNEFTEGRLETGRKSRNKIKKANIDVSSRNEFLDKSKPADVRKHNKDLDLNFP